MRMGLQVVPHGSTIVVLLSARCTLLSLQAAAEVQARVASGHMSCKR